MVAADLSNDFGVVVKFHAALSIDTAGNGTLDDQVATKNTGSKERSLFMNRNVSPGPDPLGASLADFHIPQINENATIRALGGAGLGRSFVHRTTIKTKHPFAGQGPARGGAVTMGTIREPGALGYHVSFLGASPTQGQRQGYWNRL